MGKYVEFARECYATFLVSGKEGLWRLYEARCLSEDGNINAVIGFIVVAAVMAIGVVVLATISTATPALNETSPFYALQATVETTTVSGYGLLVVSLIVIAMVSVIGYLMMMSGRRQ